MTRQQQVHPAVLAVGAVALGAGLAVVTAGGSGTTAMQDLSAVEYATTQLSDTVYLVEPRPGLAGNLAVSVGADGILLVDSDMMPLTDRIKATIADLQPGAIDFMVNTHYHYDHAGGNAGFGLDSLIVAHESIRRRLMEGREAGNRFRDTPTPTEALPVLTFEDGVALHWNGERIDAIRTSNPSHTDGDTVVFFRDSNVIHTGDQYVNLNGFPYIDRDVGGSAPGLRDNIAEMLAMIDDETRVIPGHGPLATKADLQHYHDQVAVSIAHIEEAKNSGQTVQQIQEAGLPERFTGFTGFQPEGAWIQYVFDSLDD